MRATGFRRGLVAGGLLALGCAVPAVRGLAQTGGGAAPAAVYRVATFDSGFGGYFTAKEIEKQARALSADGFGPFVIAHYGDTTNVPYGEKTPAQIASFASAGILAAFRDGARDVFIACNTASTQVEAIREIVRAQDPAFPNHVYSILDVSVREVMKTVSVRLRGQDTVEVAILATPATVRSENYPRLLAKALGVPLVPGTFTKLTQPRWMTSKGPSIDSYAYTTALKLGPAKRVVITQLAPANWVEMIENGAGDAEKRAAVRRDLELLTETPGITGRFDVVGEFCTHYPVFDGLIQSELRRLGRVADGAPFVVQGPIMGQLFRDEYLRRTPVRAGAQVLPPGTPAFYMTGTNAEAIRGLIRKVFPGDPEPLIAHKDFPVPK
jgi:glutamate racemase